MEYSFLYWLLPACLVLGLALGRVVARYQTGNFHIAPVYGPAAPGASPRIFTVPLQPIASQ
ncbi:DUF6130 family protein [Hymenobacter terricola]|uniref:DUF6130 family protein n=1 Tax=Hymenobacter terricola TaxID=2819236 RepID=UPI001B3023D3|nr:DUF6130 family protein [Hymenobacter terricola]